MKKYLASLSMAVFVIPVAAFIIIALSTPAYAMHISEGILPLPWAGLWYVLAMPFMAKGIFDIKKRTRQTSFFIPLIGMVSAMVFIISAMPIPVPIAGTCSHPAGTGLAAILVGPFVTVVATSIALLIQALFLAHGGITTLGANILSMGVVGAFSGYFTFKVLTKAKVPLVIAAFLAGLASDWLTYAMTSFELALGLSEKGMFLKLYNSIALAFVPTQLPIGILEGFAAAGLFAFVLKRRPDILINLGVIKPLSLYKEGIGHEEVVY
ncbi:MAG: energy-coupling factor ABC transporter permease [Actinomycetota bacterium]|nr:energy-coupling factor ABC transporter permease [Actinomycetota bacterium]